MKTSGDKFEPRQYWHAYITALETAIRQFTDRLDRQYPGIFNRGGVSVKRAYQVLLYSQATGSQSLLNYFALHQSGCPPQKWVFSSQYEYDIATEFGFSEGTCSVSIGHRVTVALKRAVPWWLVVMGWKWVHRRRQNRFSADSSTVLKHSGYPPVLVWAHHARYLKFLTPVFRHSPNQFGVPSLPFCPLNGVSAPSGVGFFRFQVPWVDHRYRKVPFYDRIVLLSQYCEDVLSRWTPKKVVVVEGNSYKDDILAVIARSKGISSVCVQFGWSPDIHMGFKNLPYDRFLSWGDGFSELLKLENPEPVFTSCGSVEMAHVGPSVRESAQRPWLTFFSQGIGGYISAAHADALVRLAIWAAVACPDVQVVFREHPRFPLSDQDRQKLIAGHVKLASPAEVRLSDVLAKSKAMVTFYSTTLLEGICWGVYPILLNIISLPKYQPDVVALGVGSQVASIEDAQAEVQRIMSPQWDSAAFSRRREAFCRDYFSGLAHDSAKVVYNDIMSGLVCPK